MFVARKSRLMAISTRVTCEALTVTSKRKVLILVPYKARDLESHALVGYYLVRKFGHEVVFTNGYGFEKKILTHSPDVVVMDHLAWNFKVEQARLAKSLGMKVVILPTEGLFQDEEGAVRRAGTLHNGSNLPDKYLTWGDFPRRALLNRQLMTEDQVVTVGCPRFDFYKPPFTKLFRDRSAVLAQLGFADPSAPMILWATNTSYASRSPRKMLRRQMRNAKKPIDEVKNHISDHMVQFAEHSRLVEELAKRNPGWNFIIKVHPAEWVNPYFDISERISNIKVAYNMPVREFLYHTDVLLQRNCTTATEAWILGKPTINLEVGNYLRPVREEYSSGTTRVTDLASAESAIIKFLSGASIESNQLKIRDEFIRDFYFETDGKSAERAASAISGIVAASEFSDEKVLAKDRLVSEKRKKIADDEDASLFNRLKDLLGVRRSQSLRFWKNWFRFEARDNLGLFVAEPEISSEMVDEIFDQLDKLNLGDNSDRHLWMNNLGDNDA